MHRFILSHGMHHVMPMHLLRQWYQEGKQKRQHECPQQQHVPKPMTLPFIGTLSLSAPQGLGEQIAKRKTGTGTGTEQLTGDPCGAVPSYSRDPTL